MTTPFVDVVIACHDPSRPVARAVRSVLADEETRRLARVTVVAHNHPASVFVEQLEGIGGSWRVLEHDDGIQSPAGPFNHGLDQVTAEYCAVMGSDDFLEPGALAAWVRQARRSRADMVIAPMRIDGQPVMLNPLPRLGRTRHLDAAHDRLLYRTAPLGLLRTTTVSRLGLRMTEGMPTGEDITFGVRMLTEADRVDFPFRTPCYVIGTDAPLRTSHATLGIDAELEPLARLLDDVVSSRWRAAHCRALAIKFTRISILGAARARPTTQDWSSGDVAALSAMLERLDTLSPGMREPLSRQERVIVDAIGNAASAADIVDAVARSISMTSRTQRLLPQRWRFACDRESILRRYLVYAFRERRLG